MTKVSNDEVMTSEGHIDLKVSENRRVRVVDSGSEIAKNVQWNGNASGRNDVIVNHQANGRNALFVKEVAKCPPGRVLLESYPSTRKFVCCGSEWREEERGMKSFLSYQGNAFRRIVAMITGRYNTITAIGIANAQFHELNPVSFRLRESGELINSNVEFQVGMADFNPSQIAFMMEDFDSKLVDNDKIERTVVTVADLQKHHEGETNAIVQMIDIDVAPQGSMVDAIINAIIDLFNRKPIYNHFGGRVEDAIMVLDRTSAQKLEDEIRELEMEQQNSEVRRMRLQIAIQEAQMDSAVTSEV